ncbi:MAG: metallophosphoesterase [Ferruginibacter sp.]|nr:metallophosphoesterase [Ferruginibacter sp.]
MQNRRNFLKQAALATGAVLSSNSLLAEMQEDVVANSLTILHTNDVHSRIDPFPMDGGRNQGLGGVAPRMELINRVRRKEKNVLLLDAGDIFQGTPYFNLYKGEPEMKAMGIMGYDAATLGNHDFDAGLENFATQLQHGKFPIILCNYDMSNTPMENKIQPYKIFRKGKLKIGITGVGIELDGLVPQSLYGNTKYLDPIQNANTIASKLKKDEGCDMVICLSHLGYKYKENKISDIEFAKQSENIDLILGGHTHTFLDAPEIYKNKQGSDVLINQVGFGGIILGRLDFEFGKLSKKNLSKAHSVVVGKKTNE